MQISKEAQAVIKEFLGMWWSSLSSQAQNTLIIPKLPTPTADQLYSSDFGCELITLAAAAEGLLDRNKANIGKVSGFIQHVLEWMFARPGMPTRFRVPAEFWGTPIGNITVRASMWCADDELITVPQAIKLSRRTASSLSQFADRGKLTKHLDPDQPNPQRSTLYRLSEIKALPKPKLRKVTRKTRGKVAHLRGEA